MRIALALLLCAAAGCGKFEDPEIVLDLRVLGVRASPPEVVVAAEDPSQIDLADLPEMELCALLADPAEERRLVYDFIACAPTEEGRCAAEGTRLQIGDGVAGDPELADPRAPACGVLSPTPELTDVILESIEEDPLGGFDGVPVQVELSVRPEGGDAEETVYAVKTIFFSDERPAGRRANENPRLERVEGLRVPTGERGRNFVLPLGRCGEVEPPIAAIGEELTFLPREPEGVREDYVLPTFEGGSREFTEVLRYAWHSSEGKWNRFQSGGPRDAAGNVPPLDATWTAPADPEVVGDRLDVHLWLVQRDERGGLAWYESCVRVEP